MYKSQLVPLETHNRTKALELHSNLKLVSTPIKSGLKAAIHLPIFGRVCAVLRAMKKE